MVQYVVRREGDGRKFRLFISTDIYSIYKVLLTDIGWIYIVKWKIFFFLSALWTSWQQTYWWWRHLVLAILWRWDDFTLASRAASIGYNTFTVVTLDQGGRCHQRRTVLPASQKQRVCWITENSIPVCKALLCCSASYEIEDCANLVMWGVCQDRDGQRNIGKTQFDKDVVK